MTTLTTIKYNQFFHIRTSPPTNWFIIAPRFMKYKNRGLCILINHNWQPLP